MTSPDRQQTININNTTEIIVKDMLGGGIVAVVVVIVQLLSLCGDRCLGQHDEWPFSYLMAVLPESATTSSSKIGAVQLWLRRRSLVVRPPDQYDGFAMRFDRWPRYSISRMIA
jgi:hypothetical protein